MIRQRRGRVGKFKMNPSVVPGLQGEGIQAFYTLQLRMTGGGARTTKGGTSLLCPFLCIRRDNRKPDCTEQLHTERVKGGRRDRVEKGAMHVPPKERKAGKSSRGLKKHLLENRSLRKGESGD